MHRHLIGLLVVHLILGPVSSTVVSAQAQARISAVATDVSPVYLRPDGTLPPLRTAAPGTRFVVVKESGEWVHVEFEDPEHGRRVGWVRRSQVRIDNPATTPMDLSVPDRATASAPLQRSGEQQAAAMGQALPVRIVEDEDLSPGRGRLITGIILTSLGVGLIALEAAYDCHYGDFDYCSDEDQAILVGATAMTGVGVALWGAGAAANARAARRSAPRPQLQYSFRF